MEILMVAMFLAVVCFLSKYPQMLGVMACVIGTSLLSIMAAASLGADASVLFGYSG